MKKINRRSFITACAAVAGAAALTACGGSGSSSAEIKNTFNTMRASLIEAMGSATN